MKLESLKDMLVDELKDLWSAENQLVKALPKMAKAATSKELRTGFEHHLKQTKRQVERLEEICEQLGTTPRGKKCKAMEALIEEGKELMQEDAEPAVLDVGLICAAQKVEHYEMAGYGCARTWAEQLGLQDAVALLDETLQEEKETDVKLTELATTSINLNAPAEDAEDDTPRRNGSKAVAARKNGQRAR